MSMQKGKHQSGQTQGYPQRYPHVSSYISRSSTPQRPEVGFHMPGAGFPQQQGGAGPPSAPQLRAIHHPHHSGNPSIPPPHQQQPPPQAQSQHTGGPQGPAPTSTPPGPAEMGKQGPPHMQGQPPMQQGGQMPLNFVPNQTRAQGSQPFFPRGPAPRMPNHRNQVVNMQPNNVGQQMFSQHMSMSQVQQIYGQGVMPAQIATPQMFVQPQLSVFASQPRHQNHTGSGYYQQTAPQQILMTPQVYQSYQHPAPSAQYYYQSPVGLPRPSGGVTGAPGPGGLAGAGSQPVMTGGPPSAQLGQPGGPVALGIVQGPGGVVGVGGLAGDSTTAPTTTSATTGKQTRRRYAIDIIDPKTMKNVDVYEGSVASSGTPPRSGESSARGTPQPNMGPGAMDVAAEFAARVAKAASEKSSPPPPPPPPPPPVPLVPQTGPPAYLESSQVVTTNGPDPSGTNSISSSEGMSPGSILIPGDALAISKQQIIVVDESSNITPVAPPTVSPVAGTPSTWKQGQLPHSPSTNLGSKPSDCSNSKSNISNQAVSDEKVGLNKLVVDPQVVDFVPSSSVSEVKISAVAVKDSDMTPVVSAQANAPTVEVVRSNREQFPALKPSAPLHQSPRRKQSQRPEAASSVPQATTVALIPSAQTTLPPALATSREVAPTAEIKVSKKPAPTEESTPSSAFPVTQSPKEKRDQDKSHGREREKSSSVSQSRGEREKSASSSSSSSQHHVRDREKSSRDKDKPSTAPQGGPKDNDKSASKSSTTDATPVPSPIAPIAPAVDAASTLPQPEQSAPARPVATAEETKQQTNGEVPAADTTDGKASHRSKPKQQRNVKMRDINRKGAEKEGGTDMDAFTEPCPEEAAPLTPPSLSPVSQPSVPATPNRASDNQIVQDEETEADKEEKLVAARNEENAKVSAATLKEDVGNCTTPVIENIPAAKSTVLALRHTYKEDQWSPLNPEGKKKYERDFLMELQNDPQSKRKPDNLPDLEIVLKDNTNRQRVIDRTFFGMNRTVPDRSSHDSFTPGFMKTPNSRGQPLAKRNSQQGKAKSNKPVIHVTLSLKEDVQLRETENAWKPGRMKPTSIGEQDSKTEDLYRKVRGVLNKLTPQKFRTLVSQVQALPIDSSDRLKGVINLVFEKAVDEPNFSEAYAQMCKVLSSMQVPAERRNKDEQEVTFRKLLVNRCQAEFEKNSEADLNREAKREEIEQTTDPEKKKELQLSYEEEERRIRMKSVGNIRFIGELFKLGMLTTNIMQRCIRHLLTEGDEESLECLCKLLTTIGKDLENKNNDLSEYFSKMKEISQKRGEVSSRVRFMLRDVIDLRQSKWIPRRNDSNPKTIDQIQKEAEKESLDQQLLLNSTPQPPRLQDDRALLNRKNRGVGGTSEDGWNTVGITGRPARYTVDTTKLKVAKEEFGIVLGNAFQYSNWSGGANAKGKDANKRSVTTGSGPTYSPNFYAALDTTNEDGKRPPPPPPSSTSSRPGPGKTTPSPSMEKERMLASFKTPAEGDRQQSRSGTSRSSSRDNSARRGGDEPSSLRPFAPSSQSPSVSASTEDVSGSEVIKNPEVSVTGSVLSLSVEEVQKKTLSLLEEFLLNINYKESETFILETFSTENLSLFVRESLNDMLERTSTARQNVGKLMSQLVKADVITISVYLSGLNQFLEFADDIAIDVPKFWPYTAEFIVPMLLSDAMSFADFREVAQPSHGKLIVEVLQLLVKDKGPVWIQEKWEAAKLEWTDCSLVDKVDKFVKQNMLEYKSDGAMSAPSSASSTPLSWNSVQQKLEQFLKPDKASPSSFDQICDWISVNVGDRVKEPQFIRALMTAICQSAIESQKTTLKLNEDRFRQNQKLVLKYVDNKEELELQCLYAVQSLIHKLEHPQGLLCQIFQVLWDDGTISDDSFIAWEASADPAEQPGKAVAVKSLTTFFTALGEGEEDSSCEES
ncbi:eukaryotic translation initiation factor 4 gamma 3-like isoform X4 [Zootermopsis nevadensis]|uniref:eukaryotic translation initiation factor 4 gamma 3-like isoform X4 n=1 Tax=Zootermopsis nevadensis TaxID=136037 RepID=UPI000B8E8716|nr:eukaryotic translation initiation factor 4 gamma 3-like isoform X4 [Zootermopsis nevadensis]